VDDVNRHFVQVSETRQVLSYMAALSIEDVFKGLILAILQASSNPALCAAYSKIIDDLDDSKYLTFAMIQTACARKLWRGNSRKVRDRADTPRATPRSSPAKTDKLMTLTGTLTSEFLFFGKRTGRLVSFTWRALSYFFSGFLFLVSSL
jgi:hypothetical protein